MFLVNLPIHIDQQYSDIKNKNETKKLLKTYTTRYAATTLCEYNGIIL